MIMKTEKQNFEYSSVDTEIIKETEKAFYVGVQYWTRVDKPAKSAKMWCPKSCAKTNADGKVSAIASFILDRWVDEYKRYLSGFGNGGINVSFDMKEKERLLKAKKEKHEKEKAEWNANVKKCKEGLKPYADKHMQEMALTIRYVARFLKESNFDVDVDKEAYDDFLILADEIEKNFGTLNPIPTTYDEYKKRMLDNKAEFRDVTFMLDHFWNTWKFGDLRFSYETNYPFYKEIGVNRDTLMNVINYGLGKTFKKNDDFILRFKNIYRKLLKQEPIII